MSDVIADSAIVVNHSPVEARLASARPDEGDGITWLPAWRIGQLIADRHISPVEVTEHFLARIDDLDPHVRAFRMVDHAGGRAPFPKRKMRRGRG